MKKQRINWIWQKDLDAYMMAADKAKKDGDDYVVVPDGLEIYVVPTKLERIQAEIDRLEKELEGMSDPTDAQLIEEGKMMNLYYYNVDMLNYYKKQLNKLS